jgi:hypothetical protein
LRQSRLGIENLDWLIMIARNWPDDACVGCEGRWKVSSLSDFIEVEDVLLEDNEKLISDVGFLFQRKLLIFFLNLRFSCIDE